MARQDNSTASTKKRRHTENHSDVAHKKHKKDKKDKLRKRDKKGKSREVADVEGEFRLVKASVVVAIPPIFANDPLAGVDEILDSLVMRYVPALDGVVLSHANARFLSKTAMIKNECPFGVCPVEFDATVWSPQVGMKLHGKLNICSPDHISLLVHRTFNASIPRHHIPRDDWEFEHGPAENDPEFGPDATHTTGNVMGDDAAAAEKAADVADAEVGGRWIHRSTAEVLGGPDGVLEFTVIGLTVANQMLSLSGSIQPDPFSPEHVSTTSATAHGKTTITRKPPVQEALDDYDDDLPGAAGDLDLDDDDDPFSALGRLGDEAAAREAERKKHEVVETAAKSEKKKRKKKDKEAKDNSAVEVMETSHKKKRKKHTKE